MRIMLSGPMTGFPEWNHPAFNAAALFLRSVGHNVFNPAEIANGDTTRDPAYYMRVCFREILESDCIVTLPGWEFSRHAPIEVRAGQAIGLTVLPYSHFESRL